MQLLSAYGAEVVRLRPVSITHPDHFVNVARRRAASEVSCFSAMAQAWCMSSRLQAQCIPCQSCPRQIAAASSNCKLFDHVPICQPASALQDNAVFADQFETPANFRAHLRTGQEIWEQARRGSAFPSLYPWLLLLLASAPTYAAARTDAPANQCMRNLHRPAAVWMRL